MTIPQSVPGGQSATTERFEGPSGVLICCEDYIIYRNMDAPQHRVPIPKRRHPLANESRGIIIVSAVMHKMKVRTRLETQCSPMGCLRGKAFRADIADRKAHDPWRSYKGETCRIRTLTHGASHSSFVEIESMWDTDDGGLTRLGFSSLVL